GHLAADRALDILVRHTMQRQCRQRHTLVVARCGNALLNALKPCERCSQIRVVGNANRDGALYEHVFEYTTKYSIMQHCVVYSKAILAYSRRSPAEVFMESQLRSTMRLRWPPTRSCGRMCCWSPSVICSSARRLILPPITCYAAWMRSMLRSPIVT